MRCQFQNHRICQSKLSFVGESEPSGFKNGWQDQTQPSLLKITFQEASFVRHIFTAWNIEKLVFDGESLAIGGSTWKPPKSTSFVPRIITLPKPILTRNLEVFIEQSSHDHLSKFSLVGCQQASTQVPQPNVTLNGIVYYIGQSSNTYIQAEKDSCGNGSLALIYNTEELFALHPIATSAPESTLYFFGKTTKTLPFQLYNYFNSLSTFPKVCQEMLQINGCMQMVVL